MVLAMPTILLTTLALSMLTSPVRSLSMIARIFCFIPIPPCPNLLIAGLHSSWASIYSLQNRIPEARSSSMRYRLFTSISTFSSSGSSSLK